MTTYEKCRAIRRMIVNCAAEVMVYKTWSDEFSTKEIRTLPEGLAKAEGGKKYFDIQPAEMTDSQLEELGFEKWSDETSMRLIPLWLMPFLAEEIETECIDGKKKLTKKSEMNNDNRSGCLAYGVIPADA